MELTFSEKYVLLALDDDTGRFVNEVTRRNYGLAGSLIMELTLNENVEMQDGCNWCQLTSRIQGGFL